MGQALFRNELGIAVIYPNSGAPPASAVLEDSTTGAP